MKRLLVATTIREQLGGNRFRAMTGADNFVGGDDFLQFRLPRCGPVGARINRICVTLAPDDTYTVTGFYVAGVTCRERETCELIYAEQLRGVIERMTGLLLSL